MSAATVCTAFELFDSRGRKPAVPTAKNRRLAPAAVKETPSAATLHTASIASPCGELRAIVSDLGVVALDWTQHDPSEPLSTPPADHPVLLQLRHQLAAYFAGTLRTFTVPLAPTTGTPFQCACWAYLQTIPYAQTRTYGQQAAALGNPAAGRAVGAANGRNPVSILVPCHRVIGSTGALTGFGGGIGNKRRLLDHEQRVAGQLLVPSAGNPGES